MVHSITPTRPILRIAQRVVSLARPSTSHVLAVQVAVALPPRTWAGRGRGERRGRDGEANLDMDENPVCDGIA